MFEEDPRLNANAKMVRQRDANASDLDAMAGAGGVLGRGGMITKIRAARLAARSGTQTVIAGGRIPHIISEVASGGEAGSWLRAGKIPQTARKQWLAGMVQVQGSIELDEGAVEVVRASGRSLLPVGVRAVLGGFARGDMVSCRDAAGCEVARGLVNYNADEARRIMGSPSSEIESLLGYRGNDELIHRDNLVLV